MLFDFKRLYSNKMLYQSLPLFPLFHINIPLFINLWIKTSISFCKRNTEQLPKCEISWCFLKVNTFSFSSGVTWLVADFIFSRRALYPEHSAFSSWISALISSVVRELFSSFSSVITQEQTYSQKNAFRSLDQTAL